MFSDTRLFLEFDRALFDFDKCHLCPHDNLIFLIPVIKEEHICEKRDLNPGELVGTYKGVPVMCEQYSFQGLWARIHDNEYCKVADFD